MRRPERWLASLALGACAVGAVVVLEAAGPTSFAASTKGPSAASKVAAGEARATKSVLATMSRLNAAIRHAKDETSTVLAGSFAKLAQERASLSAESGALAAEQAQINAEVQGLAAKAAALVAEDSLLKREAAALSSRAPTTTRTGGGDRHDN